MASKKKMTSSRQSGATNNVLTAATKPEVSALSDRSVKNMIVPPLGQDNGLGAALTRESLRRKNKRGR